MRCSNCGSENLAGKKFCGDCGKALDNRCPKCGADNPAGKNFCGDCGASLDPAAPAVAQPRDPGLTGERRHLTVLFCDLVGSTHIAAQLDPEEWREMVAGYQRAAAEAISRAGGNVAKYLGDGVMAYFGYPEAHENDAERAVRAGLSILDAIAKFNQQSPRQTLSARIGIDSGAVVVGAGAGKEADVFGEAPNNAARLQALAAPGTVLISAATHRLVSGLFVVEDRGAQALKASDRPIQIYRVIQPSGVRGRLEAAAATHGLTPFVGREEELRLLLNRWERTLDGEGQVALIVGEAGIGKSRLLQHFHQQIAATPHTWAEAAAAPSFQNTPFYPISELLREFALPHGGEPADDLLLQLEPQLTSAGLKPAEAVPLIAPLLNLPVPAKYSPLAYSPEQQRRRLLTTMVNWVLGAARAQPLVIATEDLHWADPSTLELIQLLVEQGAAGRLLLLCTARPEFRAQWPLRAHHTQITLNRLNVRSTRTMVEQVAARKALSDETVAAVIERTGGVPLFVEELTRVVLETSTEKLTGREIPVTLHDSLMARLDRLGPAKEVAQVGAVIGNEFSYELISAVHPMPENELQDALHSLADADLLYVRGIAPEATYQFKHALIRDAAYEALLKSRRKELHRLVARTIEQHFPTLKETHPEVLARHWAEADEIEPAISQWSKAGLASETRGAFTEALESYQQALAWLSKLPQSIERDRRKLELSKSLSGALGVVKGLAATETVAFTERAAALAESTGTLPQLVSWVMARGSVALMSGDFGAAGELLNRALELARRDGTAPNLVTAHFFQTLVRHLCGDLGGAEKHFTSGLTFLDGLDLRQQPAPVIVSMFGTASWNAWVLGQADVARERDTRMFVMANKANPYDVAFSQYCGAYLRICMRENEQAETLAAAALELSEKNRFAQIGAYSQCLLGYAQAQLGRPSDGIALLRRGITSLLEIGTRLGVSHYMALLAEELGRESGAVEEALETIERALALNVDNLINRPETFRRRGELRLKNRQAEQAEKDFRESIALAEWMGAKTWQLRATMSLARLLASKAQGDEARVMLAEIYNWFTEGFDTADLKDAKALLDELTA
jgi:class 3 adenylate cyclase/tetratricopeptide (TPR) repeat protein